jgi:hypothetical protein
MLRRSIFIGLLIAAVFDVSTYAQRKTEVSSAKAKAMLLGKHRLSLQWISWDYFGTAGVTEKSGTLRLTGRQASRRNADYLIIDGIIASVDSREFKFDGKIVTKIGHINSGEPCVRQGEMTFKITGNRRYWRLQEMNNPCDALTDYVDIYFR